MASETHDYKGHRITLSEPEVGAEGVAAEEPALVVDDEAVDYGRFPNGEYFLHDYAYDWADDVVEVTKRWIDHRERVDAARSGGETEGGE